MRRIGIFSGAFDPVHLGHLQAAQACQRFLNLDKVLFVPFARPPVRQADAPALSRCAMLKTALKGYKGLSCYEWGLKPQPQGLARQLEAIRQAYPGSEFFYILSADKLKDVPTWQDARAIMDSIPFAAYPRAGYDTEALCDFLRSHGARVTQVPMAPVGFTSGQIRAQLRLLSDAPGKLDPRVAEYIAIHGLYQPDYERMVRQAVSPARLTHSQGVRKTAVQLALFHGLPMQKAGVAGILHDCAKNMELARLQAIATQMRLPMDQKTLSSNALLHGPVGAQVAKTRYHISDAHILNAIRYHTTGRGGMGALELLIFVADAIEPGRKYPGLELVREQAHFDLRLAALTSLEGTLQFVKTKGMAESPLSQQAIADLRNRLRVSKAEDHLYS